MKKYTIILLLLVASTITAFSQWSSPVNVSNLPERDMHAATSVDPNGVIHCVWTHFINTGFRKIYYSKSSDFGDTWSVPLDLSQNNDSTASSPQIVISSTGYLFIVYNQGYMGYSGITYMVSNKNGIWKKQKVANFIYGFRGIIMDHDDNLYLFLHHSSKIYYKIFDGQTWSNIYPTYDQYTFINDVIADQQNNLNFAGLKYTADLNYRLIYGIYQADSNLWQPVYEYAIDSAETPVIGLDQDDLPHIFYRKKSQINYNWFHPQYYIRFDGNNWSEPMLICHNSYDHDFIVNTQNHIYLFTTEIDEDENTDLVYRQIQNGIITDMSVVNGSNENFSLGHPEPVLQGNTLGITYIKPFGSFDCDVFYNSMDLISKAENTYSSESQLFSSYPNPSDGEFFIESNSKIVEPVEIKVINSEGEVIYETFLSCDGEFFRYRINLKQLKHTYLKDGMYYLIAENEKLKTIHKCIILNSN
ncbi:MAG: exo-alpha-sialidase [Bacteroidales bacterium]|nr:exo-alpha-sialidase [Bacteroidales bacterium]